MTQLPETTDILFTKINGEERFARVVPVKFSLDDLPDEDIQILSHLAEAVRGVTPVYAAQNWPHTLVLYHVLQQLEHADFVSEETRRAIADYNTLLAIRNSPWDVKNEGYLFPLTSEELPVGHPAREIVALLNNETSGPKGRGFYPSDMTDAEFAALGDEGKITNSLIVRQGTGLHVVRNEEYFSLELSLVVAALFEARLHCPERRSLHPYIHAKEREVREGSSDSRYRSEVAMLDNTDSLDFFLSSGEETYLDNKYAIRGNAQGFVGRVNRVYDGLTQRLRELIPSFEAEAPWTHKNTITQGNLPRVKFLDVLAFAGGYEVFPSVVVAECLPNNEQVKREKGTVNFVFANVQEALAGPGGKSHTAQEFLPKAAVEQYAPQFLKLRLIMTAVHELGHATGKILFDERPDNYFGPPYSVLEEGRAELFALWGLPRLVRGGIITPEEEMAGYYAMLVSMVSAMERPPTHHSGARNLMFHYFLKHHALGKVKEDGKIKYEVNPQALRSSTSDILKVVGDIRATGDREGLERLLGTYVSTEQQDTFKKRLAAAPGGWGLIFPEISFDRARDRYVRELVYSQSYRGQRRTLPHFMPNLR